ncbi:hypothetical protein M3P05_07130 [Sansalvadorimonas sp. 2012CJ34-2]|uniref:Membrane protein YkgB n=1 Tax=Parendozoicomonas callyspongiae TaxID=2942213 RepID=A0ABT0PEH7_9GAMM|nr:hypothetical protein [Sansalvadorimonas sp. 2012CJ34-2]MCL6269710.1 hypothetical protein [Sansalvadorimonas sp. 2012CJ34-2]
MFKKYLKIGLCIYIAVVFVQSLFFKFSGSPETEFIFGTLGKWSGIELFGQYGAYAVGVTELIASILLFTAYRFLGALVAAGTMSGAIFFHLFTPLGIKMPEFDASGNIVGDDGGLLFVNACAVFLAAVIVLVLEFNDQKSS